MKRYSLPLACSACLLLGLALGWYLGYTRPASKLERFVEDAEQRTGHSRQEVLRWMSPLLDTRRDMDALHAQDSLNVFGMLARGETEPAKERLAQVVSDYYVVVGPYGGNRELRAQIDEAALRNAILSNSIEHRSQFR